MVGWAGEAEHKFRILADYNRLIDHENANKIASITHHGIFNHFWIPFWLKNVIALFKRAINAILTSDKR